MKVPVEKRHAAALCYLCDLLMAAPDQAHAILGVARTFAWQSPLPKPEEGPEYWNAIKTFKVKLRELGLDKDPLTYADYATLLKALSRKVAEEVWVRHTLYWAASVRVNHPNPNLSADQEANRLKIKETILPLKAIFDAESSHHVSKP